MAIVIGQCSTAPATGACGRAWAHYSGPLAAQAGVTPASLILGSPTQQMLAAMMEACVKGCMEELLANGTAGGDPIL